MNCPKCGKPVTENQKFCGGCGAKIESFNNPQNNRSFNQQMNMQQSRQCPQCGSFLPSNINNCSKCGYNFSQQQQYTNMDSTDNSDSSNLLYGVCCLLLVIIFIFYLI